MREGVLTRPNDTAATPADPLHAHFMGRRAWHRIVCDHVISLRGVGGTSYEGQTVDLSRGGLLVAVTDPVFMGEDRDGVTLIQDHFPDGTEILFAETGILRKASIVRATLQRGAHLALGCQFEQILGVHEALELGIVAGESGVAEAASALLPFVPKAGVQLTLMIHGSGETLAGPLALGQVAAMGERTVEAVLDRRVDAVVAGCGNAPVEASVRVGRRKIWSGHCQLVACTPGMLGTVVRLVSEVPFNRSVRRRLISVTKALS